MAYATQVTISTGNKVSLNYQSQEVSVTLTYQIEREDADVLALVKEKTIELAQAHRAAWQTLHDVKVSAVKETTSERPETVPEPAPTTETVIAPTQTTKSEAPEPSQTMEVPPMLPAPGLPAQALSAPVPRITPGQLAALLLLLAEAKWSEQSRHDYLRERFFCESVDELNTEQAKEWLLELQRAEREAAQKETQQRRLENAHRNGTP